MVGKTGDMRIQYDLDFIKTLKKADVKIRKAFKKRIAIFSKDPFNPQLNNHPLRKEYQGLRSIDITNDWRAVYEDIREKNEDIVYFVIIGTHKDLFR